MDVENKGFHSQEGILPCQRNRSVSLFERSPRRSLVRNQDDDKAWQSGQGPPGMGGGCLQELRRTPGTRHHAALWFLNQECHGTQTTSSSRGHAGSAPITPRACNRGSCLVTKIRCEGSRKKQHRADSTRGPAAKDPPQASEVNRPEPKCHCASSEPWALGKPHLPHSSARKCPWCCLPLSTSGDKVKTIHRHRRHTDGSGSSLVCDL